MLDNVADEIELNSPRNALAPPTSVQGKPKTSEDIRHNGCQWPFSPGQIMTWLAIFTFLMSFVFLIAPVAFSSNHASKDFLVPTFLFLLLSFIVIYNNLYATLYVATDKHLLGRHVSVDKMNWGVKDRIFQSVPAVHNLKWCDLCEWVIDGKSAHCLTCKKCTYDVSHHCWFVNNCIGQGNYTAFITLLVSFLVMTITEFCLSIRVIWLITKNPDEFDNRWAAFYSKSLPDSSTSQVLQSTQNSVTSIRGLVAPFLVILLLLLIAATGLIVQFLSFQVMLKWRGMTMLEYVSRGNEESSEQDGVEAR